MCSGGTCVADPITGECNTDDDACTLGTCTATGCDESATKDCSAVIHALPHDDRICNVASCDPTNGHCSAVATNEGGDCGGAGNRKLLTACGSTCVGGTCTPKTDCGPPPPTCPGPVLGETCTCTGADCTSPPGPTSPCCEGLCLEAQGNSRECQDLSCLDEGGNCGNNDGLCCPGLVCFEGSCISCPFAADGKSCSQCKELSGDLFGVCSEVGANQDAQATCGTETCTGICNLVCGTSFSEVTPDNCSNNGGGNCQGVFTPLGVDFMGGPCCKCTTPCADLTGTP